MFYFPGLITAIYAYFAVKKTDLQEYAAPATQVVENIIVNLTITEIIFMLGWLFEVLGSNTFSIMNLALFYIMQDIYFYCVHRFLFHGPLWRLHHIHHLFIDSHAAWYGHFLEHILLNLGSIVVPFYLFPNTSLVMFLVILQQIYTSVNGHTKSSPHSIHHSNRNRRFGSIYLLDRLTGTF